MTYQEFQETLLEQIKALFSENTQIQIKTIMKNNSLKLDSLIITEDGCNISPTIYLNYYYNEYLQGCTMEKVCDDIIATYEAHRMEEGIDISFFSDFEKISQRIIYKLVNYSKNLELLADVPHVPYLDLAIVFCYLLDHNDNSSASILIHNSHLEYWNVTCDELMDCATRNTPRLLEADLRDMRDMMTEILPDSDGYILDELPEDTMEIFVLTNHAKLNGACCILYQHLLHDFAKKLNRDLFILPSSIHEVLLIPALPGQSKEELTDMVREVNMTQVAPEEILSDHAYYYSISQQAVSY